MRRIANLAVTSAVVAGLGVMTLAGTAHAQNAATAQGLFDQAKALMAQGKANEACPKFAESQKLDPGLGTLLNLGACYEATGLAASAWSTFLEAESVARADGNQEGIRISQERAAALAPKLSKLVINVTGQPAPGLEVKRDGTPVGQAQWGTPIPADPGKHSIVASAPGRATFETEVTLTEPGSTEQATIPELAPAPAAAAPGHGDQAPSEGKGGLTTQHYLAIGAGVVGVAGVAVGTIFGLQAMSKHDDADKHCDGSACRDQEGVDLRADARSAGNISTIGFIVGGVGLAGGVALWFTAGPTDGAPKTGLVVGPGRVALRGTF